MANVLASVAQYETEVRAERVRAGQAVARANGRMPKVKASEVMTIGRRRIRTASRVASRRVRPSSCRILAKKAAAAEEGISAPGFATLRRPQSLAPPPDILRYGAAYGRDEQQRREAAE